MPVKVAPKGMGLNDFVAIRRAFSPPKDLTSNSTGRLSTARNRAGRIWIIFSARRIAPIPRTKDDVVQGARLWGTICNASAGMGRAVSKCYGELPWAIFVRPHSKFRKPEDLKDVPVSVGMRAGSHFNVPYRLEKYLPLENIKTVNTGGFGARLKALLDGEVEAASLLPPQIAMAEQLGLRKIIEDRFHTLWWVPANEPPEVVADISMRSNAPRRRLKANLPKHCRYGSSPFRGVRGQTSVGFQHVRPRRTLRQ